MTGLCCRGPGLMPFVYLAGDQDAAAPDRADTCARTPARSSPANQSRLHFAISLPTAHHNTPRPELSSAQTSRTRCQLHTILSKPLDCRAREKQSKVSLVVGFSSLANYTFHICLRRVRTGGGFEGALFAGPLICLDRIKVVSDDKSCLDHQLWTPSFAVARQLWQRNIVRSYGTVFSPKLWQKVETPDSLILGAL